MGGKTGEKGETPYDVRKIGRQPTGQTGHAHDRRADIQYMLPYLGEAVASGKIELKTYIDGAMKADLRHKHNAFNYDIGNCNSHGFEVKERQVRADVEVFCRRDAPFGKYDVDHNSRYVYNHGQLSTALEANASRMTRNHQKFVTWKKLFQATTSLCGFRVFPFDDPRMSYFMREGIFIRAGQRDLPMMQKIWHPKREGGPWARGDPKFLEAYAKQYSADLVWSNKDGTRHLYCGNVQAANSEYFQASRNITQIFSMTPNHAIFATGLLAFDTAQTKVAARFDLNLAISGHVKIEDFIGEVLKPVLRFMMKPAPGHDPNSASAPRHDILPPWEGRNTIETWSENISAANNQEAALLHCLQGANRGPAVTTAVLIGYHHEHICDVKDMMLYVQQQRPVADFSAHKFKGDPKDCGERVFPKDPEREESVEPARTAAELAAS